MTFRWFLSINVVFIMFCLYSCEKHDNSSQVEQADLYYISPDITLWGRTTERSIRKLEPIIIRDNVVIDSIQSYIEKLKPMEPTHDFMSVYILCYLRYGKGSKAKLLYDGFTIRYNGNLYEKDEELIDYLGIIYQENSRK